MRHQGRGHPAHAGAPRPRTHRRPGLPGHIGNILQKPELHIDGEGHRRVLAVLTYLRA
ncbi:hypothetical protein [Streptomyces sp. NPDC006012]|uniref:hypothetical protein n=1 Tax=Streptomyces sp. NPDC006012 TaxID=3364739 RepID=UPI0036BC6877